MRNTSQTKIVLTILVLALLAISACTTPSSSSSSPPGVTGEPQLSISGSTTADTTDDMEDTSDDTDSMEDTSDSTEDTGTTTPDDTDTQPTVTDDIPTKTVNAGELVSFDNLQAQDPDGDTITFTFESPLDSEGKWQTTRSDAGTYLTTVTASDGQNEVTQRVRIVVQSTNEAPTIRFSDITVNEGDTIELEPEVSDEDGDDVEVTFSGFMTSNRRSTTAADIGSHKVTITATDGIETTTREITVTVADVNHEPVLMPINDVEVTEGEVVRIIPSASDKDEDAITFTFSEPLDNSGRWQTQKGDEGQYSIRVTASDGENEVFQDIDVTVMHRNEAPVLTLDDDEIRVDEGETVRIRYTVTDEEGDDVEVTFSGFMTSERYTTNYDDAGEHTVTVTASDGTDSVSKEVYVTVRDVNRAPVFDKNAFS